MNAPRLVFEFAAVILVSSIISAALEFQGFQKGTTEHVVVHVVLVVTAYFMWLEPLISKLGKNL